VENSKDIFFDINLINDVIDDRVDDVTAADFFEHIKECENCRKTYEEALKIRNIIKQDGFLPGTENMPSDNFVEKTMKKIRAAKKPLIIRIINHPAAKASFAAAACLLIAVFVFRSDLFGRIEGSNGLSADMIIPESAEETVTEDGLRIEENQALYSASGASADNLNNAFDDMEEPEAYEMPAAPDAEEYFDDGMTEMPQETSSTNSAEENGLANSSLKSAATQAEAPEDEIIFTEPEYPAESAEEPYAEMPAAEESAAVVTEESEIAEDQTGTFDSYIVEAPQELPAMEEPSEPEPAPAAASQARAKYGLAATDDDINTALAVAEIIAKEKLDRGAYTKIVLVINISEDKTAIDPNVSFIGDCEYNGYLYKAYEAEIYGNTDTIAENYGSNAMVIYPDIVTEYYNKENILVIFRIDK
jgi:hypothetical protein